MNTPSPLVPQGTVPDGRGKSHIRIAVFSILAIHGVLLSTLLIFGCKKAPDQTASDQTLEQTNTTFTAPPPPSFAQSEPVPVTPAPQPAPETHYIPPVAANPTPVVPNPSPAAAPGGAETREHLVVRGDSFYTLARRFNTTMNAIAQANPTVDPTRMKPGQRLTIPPPSATLPSPSGDMPVIAATTNGKIHEVKSGDNLTSIARRHGVTVKELQSANSLRTTQIRVGQKLRIPERSAAGAADSIPPIPQ